MNFVFFIFSKKKKNVYVRSSFNLKSTKSSLLTKLVFTRSQIYWSHLKGTKLEAKEQV